MKVEGSREFRHSMEALYAAATDLKGIAGEFNQVKAIEQISDTTVRITIHLNFGVYSGDYFADLTVEDDARPISFYISGVHKSRIGGMTLKCHSELTPIDEKCNFVHIKGDFNMSGMLRMANRTIVSKGIQYGIKLMFDTIDRRATMYYDPT